MAASLALPASSRILWEVSWAQRTASHSPSTPHKNRHRRLCPSWFGSRGEVLWSAGLAKRIGTQNSSSTRFYKPCLFSGRDKISCARMLSLLSPSTAWVPSASLHCLEILQLLETLASRTSRRLFAGCRCSFQDSNNTN